MSEANLNLTHFKPESYVESHLPSLNPNVDFEKLSLAYLVTTNIAKFCKKTLENVPENSLKILDYGCGPSLPFIVSVSSKASEIVLADYMKSNRDFYQKWLDKDPLAHNWTPYFEHIVMNVEGGSKEDAAQREKSLRSKVKALVHCDIKQEEFINEGYKNTLFDVVMTISSIESGSDNLEAYKKGVEKLVSLIKPGGYFLLCATYRENCDDGFYFVNDIKFSSLPVKSSYVVETVANSGMQVIDVAKVENDNPHGNTNGDGHIFVAAKKYK